MSIGSRAYNLLKGYVQREWDRLSGIELHQAEQELSVPLMRQPRPMAKPPAGSKEEQACRLLGVSKDASFDVVQREFKRLYRRSDPANFPLGSLERTQASELHERVHWAYSVLTENVDVTVRRFKSLEIE